MTSNRLENIRLGMNSEPNSLPSGFSAPMTCSHEVKNGHAERTLAAKFLTNSEDPLQKLQYSSIGGSGPYTNTVWAQLLYREDHGSPNWQRATIPCAESWGQTPAFYTRAREEVAGAIMGNKGKKSLRTRIDG